MVNVRADDTQIGALLLIQEWVPVALYRGIVCMPPFLQLGHFDTRGGSQQRDVALDLLGSEVLH